MDTSLISVLFLAVVVIIALSVFFHVCAGHVVDFRVGVRSEDRHYHAGRDAPAPRLTKPHRQSDDQSDEGGNRVDDQPAGKSLSGGR